MGLGNHYTISKSTEERKAFLDGLMLLSLRHGMNLESPLDATFVRDLPQGWDGYRLKGPPKALLDIVTVEQTTDLGDITSRRVRALSSQESWALARDPEE